MYRGEYLHLDLRRDQYVNAYNPCSPQELGNSQDLGNNCNNNEQTINYFVLNIV